MNKKEFMNELESKLQKIPKEELDDILGDYEEHFKEGKRKKRTEASIAKSLGDPKDIAKQLKAESLVRKAEDKTNWSNTSRAVFASISLGFLNLIIVLGPFIAIVAVLLSLFVTAFSIAISGFATSISSIGGFFLPVHPLPSIVLAGGFFVGIGLLALGILMGIGVYYLTKLFFVGVVKYLKMNMNIISGDKNE